MPAQHYQPGSSSKSLSDTSEVQDTTDHLIETKAQPKPKRRKLSKEAARVRKDKVGEKENVAEADREDDPEESDHEINVNIPISDTTNVKIRVKPLDNRELKSQRIHVRVNQKAPSSDKKRKSGSRHLVYGSKSLVAHHLRKTRPPLFSRKLATPKLDRKNVIERVVTEVRRERLAKGEVEEVGGGQKPDLDFNLAAQKVLREKRTKNAQFRKMMEKL